MAQTLEEYLHSIKFQRIQRLEKFSKASDYLIFMMEAVDETPELLAVFKKVVESSVDGFLSRSFDAQKELKALKTGIGSKSEFWEKLIEKSPRYFEAVYPYDVPDSAQNTAANVLLAGIIGEFEVNNSSLNKYIDSESLKKEIADHSVERGKQKFAAMMGNKGYKESGGLIAKEADMIWYGAEYLTDEDLAKLQNWEPVKKSRIEIVPSGNKEKTRFGYDTTYLDENGVFEGAWALSTSSKEDAFKKLLKKFKNIYDTDSTPIFPHEEGWDTKMNDGGEIEDDEIIDDEPEVDEPDSENDCFVTDIVRGGYDVSCSGKFISHFSEYDDAVQAVLDWQEENKYFPTIWSVNERGSATPIDDNGDAIKMEKGGSLKDLDFTIYMFTNNKRAKAALKRVLNLVLSKAKKTIDRSKLDVSQKHLWIYDFVKEMRSALSKLKEENPNIPKGVEVGYVSGDSRHIGKAWASYQVEEVFKPFDVVGYLMPEPVDSDSDNDDYESGGEVSVDDLTVGYAEYVRRKWNSDEDTYLTKRAIEKDLAETEKLLVDFENGLIKPSKIIGTGYKPHVVRKLAKDWIEEKLKSLKTAIASEGLTISANVRNYEFQTRKALREGKIDSQTYNNLMDGMRWLLQEHLNAPIYAKGGKVTDKIFQLKSIGFKGQEPQIKFAFHAKDMDDAISKAKDWGHYHSFVYGDDYIVADYNEGEPKYLHDEWVTLESGGKVGAEKKYVSVAPKGTCFVKVGSHRASDRIARMGIEFIGLYNLYSTGSAGQNVILIYERDYKKIKDIKSVSAPFEKLTSKGMAWRPVWSDEQSEILWKLYREANPVELGDGGEIEANAIKAKDAELLDTRYWYAGRGNYSGWYVVVSKEKSNVVLSDYNRDVNVTPNTILYTEKPVKKKSHVDGGEIDYTEIEDAGQKMSSGEMFKKYGLEIANTYVSKKEAEDHAKHVRDNGIEAFVIPDKGNYHVFTKNKTWFQREGGGDVSVRHMDIDGIEKAIYDKFGITKEDGIFLTSDLIRVIANRDDLIPIGTINLHLAPTGVSPDFNAYWGDVEVVKKALAERGWKFDKMENGGDVTVQQIDSARNEGWRKLKISLGERGAKKYFEQVDKLLPPYSSNIVEYRPAGVVTKDGSAYTFHALSDTSLKNWRVGFKADVTEQFADGGSISNIVGKIYRPPHREKSEHYVTVKEIDFDNVTYKTAFGEEKTAKTKDFFDSYIQLAGQGSKVIKIDDEAIKPLAFTVMIENGIITSNPNMNAPYAKWVSDGWKFYFEMEGDKLYAIMEGVFPHGKERERKPANEHIAKHVFESHKKSGSGNAVDKEREFAIAQEKANWLVYQNHVREINDEEKNEIDRLNNEMEKIGDSMTGDINWKHIDKVVKELELARGDADYLQWGKDMDATEDVEYASGGEVKPVDLGLYGLGNGLTVADRNRQENRDYKKVAHIAEDGTITYYDKKLPADAIKEIEGQAEWLKGVVAKWGSYSSYINYAHRDNFAEGGEVGEWLAGKANVGGDFHYGAKGLSAIREFSQKYPKNVYLVTDDNSSHIGNYWLKNGKFAEVKTWGNPEYDLQHPSQLRGKDDVIYKFKRVNKQDFYATGGKLEIPSSYYWFIFDVIAKKIIWGTDVQHQNDASDFIRDNLWDKPDFKKENYKIYNGKQLREMGIDPFDTKNWGNYSDGGTPNRNGGATLWKATLFDKENVEIANGFVTGASGANDDIEDMEAAEDNAWKLFNLDKGIKCSYRDGHHIGLEKTDYADGGEIESEISRIHELFETDLLEESFMKIIAGVGDDEAITKYELDSQPTADKQGEEVWITIDGVPAGILDSVKSDYAAFAKDFENWAKENGLHEPQILTDDSVGSMTFSVTTYGDKKKDGGEAGIPAIVAKAMLRPITDVGQLSAQDIKDLNKYVAKGALIKGKGGSYPKLKTVYAIVGHDIAKDRQEAIDDLFEKMKILEPQNIVHAPSHEKGGNVKKGEVFVVSFKKQKDWKWSEEVFTKSMYAKDEDDAIAQFILLYPTSRKIVSVDKRGYGDGGIMAEGGQIAYYKIKRPEDGGFYYTYEKRSAKDDAPYNGVEITEGDYVRHMGREHESEYFANGGTVSQEMIVQGYLDNGDGDGDFPVKAKVIFIRRPPQPYYWRGKNKVGVSESLVHDKEFIKGKSIIYAPASWSLDFQYDNPTGDLKGDKPNWWNLTSPQKITFQNSVKKQIQEKLDSLNAAESVYVNGGELEKRPELIFTAKTEEDANRLDELLYPSRGSAPKEHYWYADRDGLEFSFPVSASDIDRTELGVQHDLLDKYNISGHWESFEDGGAIGDNSINGIDAEIGQWYWYKSRVNKSGKLAPKGSWGQFCVYRKEANDIEIYSLDGRRSHIMPTTKLYKTKPREEGGDLSTEVIVPNYGPESDWHEGDFDYNNYIAYDKGGKAIAKKDSMYNWILSKVPDISIETITGIQRTHDVTGIRLAALDILRRDGDQVYSLASLKTLLQQAKGDWFENEAEAQFNHEDGGEVAKTATVLIISSENPLSTQLQKLTGDSWNMNDFEDLEKGQPGLIKHKKSGALFVVFSLAYYVQIDKHVTADNLSWLKNTYGITSFIKYKKDGTLTKYSFAHKAFIDKKEDGGNVDAPFEDRKLNTMYKQYLDFAELLKPEQLDGLTKEEYARKEAVDWGKRMKRLKEKEANEILVDFATGKKVGKRKDVERRNNFEKGGQFYNAEKLGWVEVAYGIKQELKQLVSERKEIYDWMERTVHPSQYSTWTDTAEKVSKMWTEKEKRLKEVNDAITSIIGVDMFSKDYSKKIGEILGEEVKLADGGDVESRIDSMVKSWKKDGRAFSKLVNNDNEFFERIGVPYEKIGTTSQEGSDIVYYNTRLYDSDTDALRHKKKIELTYVGQDDGTGGLRYKGTDGDWYMEVNGVIHDLTEEGEPIGPVYNTVIKEGEPIYNPEDRFGRNVGSKIQEYAKGGHAGEFNVGDYVWLDTDYGKHYGKITGDYSDPKFYVGDKFGYDVEGIGDRIEPGRLHKATEAEYEKNGMDIIGRTKSGKPIYRTKKAIEYSDFTYQDHQDAADLHYNKHKSENFRGEKAKNHYRRNKEHQAMRDELDLNFGKSSTKTTKDLQNGNGAISITDADMQAMAERGMKSLRQAGKEEMEKLAAGINSIPESVDKKDFVRYTPGEKFYDYGGNEYSYLYYTKGVGHYLKSLRDGLAVFGGENVINPDRFKK